MAPKKKARADSRPGGSKAKDKKSAKIATKPTKSSSSRAKRSAPSGVRKREIKPKRKTIATLKRQSSSAKKPCGLCLQAKAGGSETTETPAAKHHVATSAAAQRIAATATSTPMSEVSLVMRSRSSSLQHVETGETLNEPTPAFLQQLREAAQTPAQTADVETFSPCATPSLLSSGSGPSLLASDKGPKSPTHREVQRGKSPKRSLANEKTTPVRVQLQFDASKADMAVLSTTSRLVLSSEDSNVYQVTVQYRMPANIQFGAPQLNIAFPPNPCIIVSSDDEDSDDEPLIKRVAAREANRRKTLIATAARTRQGKAPTIQCKPTRSFIHSLKGHEEALEVRPRASKSRTPATSAHNSHCRRITPIRHKTPVNWLSSRRAALDSQSTPTPRAFSLRSTTVRRKEQWNKVMDRMLDYNTRHLHFPQCCIFSGPVQDNTITLPRLELFWKRMSNLIANRKIFARKLFEHWEKLDTCIRLVNETLNPNLRGEEAFRVIEGRAALSELGRRRMLWVAGGKVMLTRNALSTRKS